MKKSMYKKLMAGIMTTIMVVGTLAACGSKSTNDESAASNASTSNSSTDTSETSNSSTDTSESSEGVVVSYPIQGYEDVTLTIALSADTEANVTMHYEDMAHTPYGEYVMEATGINFEVLMPTDSSAMTLLMASGELPDLIWFDWDNYNGGISQAVKDGVILPLDDYLEYCPDLMKVLESNDAYINAVKTNEGQIVGAPFIRGDASLMTSAGLQLRADWLEELGLDMPETPEDLYNVLVAFRDEKGATIPFTLISDMVKLGLEHGILTSPFGLAKCEFYVDNGTVHYGYAESSYKDVLVYLHKLYEEGLLDPNYASADINTTRANMMNGTSGVSLDTAGSGLATSIKNMRKTDATFDLAGFGPLVAKSGDTPMSSHYDSETTGYYMCVTPQCKNVEAAVQFINWCFTEDGCTLHNYGVEGKTYTKDENGKITYTDYVLNNPDGWTSNQALAAYTRTGTGGFPFFQKPKFDLGLYIEEQSAAVEQWSNSSAADYYYPNISVLEEDQNEYNRLSPDISTFIGEMTSRYITGVESLDTFESTYMNTLEKMGVDTLIEMKQKAYDNYTNR